MDLGLQGKWALVCGASRGLGWGCAQALAQEGVNVLMVARRADVLEAGAAEIRASLAADNAAQVQVCAQDITTEAGRAAVFALRRDFDIVVTNVNDAPTLVTPLADKTTAEGAALRLTLPATAFADVDVGDVITYSAKLASGAALPSWLSMRGRSPSAAVAPLLQPSLASSPLPSA